MRPLLHLLHKHYAIETMVNLCSVCFGQKLNSIEYLYLLHNIYAQEVGIVRSDIIMNDMSTIPISTC